MTATTTCFLVAIAAFFVQSSSTPIAGNHRKLAAHSSAPVVLNAEGNYSRPATAVSPANLSAAVVARVEPDPQAGDFAMVPDSLPQLVHDVVNNPLQTLSKIPLLRVALFFGQHVLPVVKFVANQLALHLEVLPVLVSNRSMPLWAHMQARGGEDGLLDGELGQVVDETAMQQQDIEAPAEKGPLVLFMDWSIETVVALLFGLFFYKQKHVTGFVEDADPRETFLNGHLTCCEDSRTCLFALCCPGLRWADSVSMSGIATDTVFLTLSTFWTLFVFFSTAALADAFGGFCLAMLLTYYRQKLRELLDVPHGSCGNVLSDFVYAFFCPCCLIAQEARVVNQMALVGKIVLVGKTPERLPAIDSMI